jgi:hypothetical protein
MTLNLKELIAVDSDHLWLEFSQEDQEEAWRQAQDCSNATARWNAYLNHLCLKSFLDWLRAEPDIKEQLSVWPCIEVLSSIWEVVNGTAIDLGETRFILIPSEADNLEELCVPQEWVDIPGWEADYYLAVQVEPEERWMRIWGYTSYQELKKEENYDPLDQTYSLERDDLIEDINVMLVTRQFCMKEKAPVSVEPIFSAAEAENLLARLGQPSPYSPRLDVPFEQWASLLANDNWRQELYQRRRLKDLRQRLEKLFRAGWQPWEELQRQLQEIFAPTPISETIPAFRSRETISDLINLLHMTQDELTRQQAAGVLGEIGVGDADAINALTELLRTTQDENTRWQAAISLGKVDPGNPEAAERKARLIDLGMQLKEDVITLIVALMPRPDGRMGIFLQVRPADEQKRLPPHLKLGVLSESGEVRREAEARSDERGQGIDDFLQLRFSVSLGTRFCVRVVLNDVSFTEDVSV